MDATLSANAHTGTAYISPIYTIRATRRLTRGKIVAGDRRIEVLVTIGEPNYKAAKFIKAAKAAGEPFPIRKIQLQFPPVRKCKAKGRTGRRK